MPRRCVRRSATQRRGIRGASSGTSRAARSMIQLPHPTSAWVVQECLRGATGGGDGHVYVPFT
eukprot:7234417-Lingulodinium_polyedra.AAC.1